MISQPDDAKFQERCVHTKEMSTFGILKGVIPKKSRIFVPVYKRLSKLPDKIDLA